MNCQTSGIFQFTLPSCIFVRVPKKLLEYIDNTIHKSKNVVEIEYIYVSHHGTPSAEAESVPPAPGKSLLRMESMLREEVW